MKSFLVTTFCCLSLLLSGQSSEVGFAPTAIVYLNQGKNDLPTGRLEHNYAHANVGGSLRYTYRTANNQLLEFSPGIFRNQLQLDPGGLNSPAKFRGYTVQLPFRFGWRKVKPANGTVHDKFIGLGVQYSQFTREVQITDTSLRQVRGSFNKATPFIDLTFRKRYDRLYLQATVGSTLFGTQKTFNFDGTNVDGSGWQVFAAVGLGYWFAPARFHPTGAAGASAPK